MSHRVYYSRSKLAELTRPSTDFDLLPLRQQVLQFVEFLVRAGNLSFTSGDVLQLFERAGVLNPETQEPVRPTRQQVERCIERAVLEAATGVAVWGAGRYVVAQGLEAE